jgi:spore germination cell wall hydrolase CwlJ-like protein
MIVAWFLIATHAAGAAAGSITAPAKLADKFVPATVTPAVVHPQVVGQPQEDAAKIVNAKDKDAQAKNAAVVTPPKFVPAPNIGRHTKKSDAQDQIQKYQQALTSMFGTPNPDLNQTQPASPTAFGPLVNEQFNSMDTGAPSTDLRGHLCSKHDTDRLTCMACNIYFEARGEKKEFQVEAGRTVMSRLFSRAYASANTTACDIVYAPKQYSWTEDSLSNRLPEDGAALQTAVEAAREALRLGPSQYTNYYAPAAANPDWAHRGTCAATLTAPGEMGNHRFCNIQGFVTRSESEVLTAESLANGRGLQLGGSDAATDGAYSGR